MRFEIKRASNGWFIRPIVEIGSAVSSQPVYHPLIGYNPSPDPFSQGDDWREWCIFTDAKDISEWLMSKVAVNRLTKGEE